MIFMDQFPSCRDVLNVFVDENILQNLYWCCLGNFGFAYFSLHDKPSKNRNSILRKKLPKK